MIIGLSGRKHSGKTEFSNVLVNHFGFKRASFACGLKKIVAELYNWSEQSLYDPIQKEEILKEPVLWNDYACSKLMFIINKQLNFTGSKIFKTRREAMQYIGSDVIRNHDPDFHINYFKNHYKEGDWVCDDMRFQNEKKVLDDMGAKSIYILRPYYWNYSNHISEISLNRNDFDLILLNNQSLEDYLNKSFYFCLDFVKNSYNNDRNQILDLYHKNGIEGLSNLFKTSKKTSKFKLNNKYLVDTKNNKNNFFSQSPNEINSYWAGIVAAGTIHKGEELVFNNRKLFKDLIKLIDYKNNYSNAIYSPYIIDDLKLWNISPSSNIKVPEIINNNIDLLSSWIKGVIDGNVNENLTIESSEDSIEFICSTFSNKCTIKTNFTLEISLS